MYIQPLGHRINCTCQLCNNSGISTWPYSPPITNTPIVWKGNTLTLPEPAPFLKVRKVENGYVVVKDGKEYVITEPSQIIQFFDESK